MGEIPLKHLHLIKAVDDPYSPVKVFITCNPNLSLLVAPTTFPHSPAGLTGHSRLQKGSNRYPSSQPKNGLLDYAQYKKKNIDFF